MALFTHLPAALPPHIRFIRHTVPGPFCSGILKSSSIVLCHELALLNTCSVFCEQFLDRESIREAVMGSNPFGHCWARSRGPGASTTIFEFFEIIVGNKRGLSVVRRKLLRRKKHDGAFDSGAVITNKIHLSESTTSARLLSRVRCTRVLFFELLNVNK
jgi:hypothetical protein